MGYRRIANVRQPGAHRRRAARLAADLFLFVAPSAVAVCAAAWALWHTIGGTATVLMMSTMLVLPLTLSGELIRTSRQSH